jgi:hypothetical protein
MYKWYVRIIFNSGAVQYGYTENECSRPDEEFNKLMLVGKPLNQGNFNTIYGNDSKNSNMSFKVSDVVSIEISDKPIK